MTTLIDEISTLFDSVPLSNSASASNSAPNSAPNSKTKRVISRKTNAFLRANIANPGRKDLSKAEYLEFLMLQKRLRIYKYITDFTNLCLEDLRVHAIKAEIQAALNCLN